jgi:hypothetical protein
MTNDAPDFDDPIIIPKHKPYDVIFAWLVAAVVLAVLSWTVAQAFTPTTPVGVEAP